jgi:hypothetical protein
VSVGIHFCPLASSFKVPVYNVTGILGCMAGVATAFIADAVLRQKAVSISFGLLLWATSAWIAWIGLGRTRQIAGSPPQI